MIVHLNDNDFAAKTAGKNTVIVDFAATWCGPCKMFAPVFEAVSEKSDAMFVKIDVDESPELARQFRVMSVPTIVKIVNGEVVGKKVGIDVYVQSFHAGAETHIYANKKNKNDITFRPVLVGVANIENMHSPDEKIDVESFKKGYNFVREFFIEYNK